MIIGYILYFTQYKNYSKEEKSIFEKALFIGVINILSGLWSEHTSDIETNTFNDIGLDIILAPILFYISYFGHRICLVLLWFELLKENWSKIKIFIITVIVIIVWLIIPKVCKPHDYKKTKAEKIFGNADCKANHYKGEFVREIPWKCKLCGYSSEVTAPDKNVPIICFGCSVSTHRCMECGLLEEYRY